MPTTPTSFRRRRGLRACALGTAGAMVLGAGVVLGGSAAFATGASASTFAELDSAFGTSGVTEIDVTAPVTDNPNGVVTLSPGNTTILDLQGNEVDLKRIQLSSVVSNQLTGATLTVVDSVGGGLLRVDNSSAVGAAGSFAAIEVDADAGSGLSIQGAAVTVLASAAASATGAGIGGGTWNGLSGASGGISILDYNGLRSVVHATGSIGGAAIGDGTGASSAVVTIGGHSEVTAVAPGTASLPGAAAAIGGGSAPQGNHVGGPNVTIGDYSTVVATSSGAGAAIGGGRYGAGGSVTVQDHASVTASGDAALGQAGIGDGASSAAGRRTSVQTYGAAQLVATGGGAGGAGIGGGAGSYGGDSLNVGEGTRVTISAATGTTAFGAPGGTVFGSLTNSGTLVLPSGSRIAVPTGASMSNSGVFLNSGTVAVAGTFSSSGSVTNTGTIATASGGVLGNSGIIANTGAITGSGTVANTGTVVQNGAFSPASVTGNAFRLVFDGQGGSRTADSLVLYAPTVSAAGLELAGATPPSAGTFIGWKRSADGTGDRVTATSNLGDLGSATGALAEIDLYAIYQIAPVLPGLSTAQGVVGTPFSLALAATSGTAPIAYAKVTGDMPAGLSLDGATGTVSGTPTTAGTFTMTVQAANDYTVTARTPVTRSYTIQIVPTSIVVTAPRTGSGGARHLAGSTLVVSVAGLQPNEPYTIVIGGTPAATGRAASSAAFVVKVGIPKGIGDGAQTVTVRGGDHAVTGSASILTASVAKALGLKLSAKKPKHGKKLSITVSKLYAGESVRVVISGKHGKTAVGKASSKGGYVLTLKSGLAKGKYTVTVTGAGTGRKASAKLTVS